MRQLGLDPLADWCKPTVRFCGHKTWESPELLKLTLVCANRWGYRLRLRQQATHLDSPKPLFAVIVTGDSGPCCGRLL